MSEAASRTIQAVVNLIRSASIRQLASPSWLEHELLPELGLSDVNRNWYPPFLQPFCGKGVQSFQQPNQFSRYLCHLSRYKISSYLEIGVWQGGTFIITLEYLSRFNDIRCALAIDTNIQLLMRQYALMNDRVLLHEGDSKTPEALAMVARDWWDLALVDGDHSEEGCFADYRAVRNAAGMIALHDIHSDVCPAVTSVWKRLSDIYPRQCLYEFTEQYFDVFRQTGSRQMGLGLIDLNFRS